MLVVLVVVSLFSWGFRLVEFVGFLVFLSLASDH